MQAQKLWEKADALDTRVQQLESELQRCPPLESLSEVGKDILEEVHLQVQLIMHHEQPLCPGVVQAGSPMVTEFTLYTPFTPAKLRNLGK